MGEGRMNNQTNKSYSLSEFVRPQTFEQKIWGAYKYLNGKLEYLESWPPFPISVLGGRK